MAHSASSNFVHRQGGFHREPSGTRHSTRETQIFSRLPDESETREYRWYITVTEWNEYTS